MGNILTLHRLGRGTIAEIGAEKPLFSVLAARGVFVYQAVVRFAVAFKAWRPLLGVCSAIGREPILTSSGSAPNGRLPASVLGRSALQCYEPRRSRHSRAVSRTATAINFSLSLSLYLDVCAYVAGGHRQILSDTKRGIGSISSRDFW